MRAEPESLPALDETLLQAAEAVRPTQGKTLAVMQASGGSTAYLVDRYSARKSSAEALSKRVNQPNI